MKSGKKSEKKSKKTLKKKKLSSNITTIILILIFLVGLSVMLYPTVSNYINQRHQSKAIAAYDEKVSEMKPEDYTKYFEAAEKYNKKLAKNPSAFYNPDEIKGYEKILDISGTGIMGYITIKKLGGETCPDNPHEGEEFGYILKGKVEIHLGKRICIAQKGDAFYYRADKTHYLKGIERTELIWVTSPPSF